MHLRVSSMAALQGSGFWGCYLHYGCHTCYLDAFVLAVHFWHPKIFACFPGASAQLMDEVVLPASKDVGGLTEDTVRKLTEDILQVRAAALMGSARVHDMGPISVSAPAGALKGMGNLHH